MVGRLLLRKVLTSYQSSLEEEQNQQLLVRLVLSYFQAQALERQGHTIMASLLEEDASKEAKASGASKRKLKRDRQKERAKAMAENAEEEIQEVPWEESQELSLLRQMGWEKVALETPPGGLGVSGRGEDERVGGARRGSLNLQDRPAEV